MDIHFLDEDNLITQSIPASLSLKCDNCSSWYQNDIRLEGEDITKSFSTVLNTETDLWNALTFIYGVSWTSIKNYSCKKGSDFLQTPDDLRFCNNCTSLLNDNYNSHLKFEQSSNSSSIVQLLKEFRDCPIISPEKQTDVQFLSNELFEAGERDIKVDLLKDFATEDPEDNQFQSEDPEEDPFQSEESVEIKYEPPSTTPDNFSDGNTSKQSRSRRFPALRCLRSKQLVIKTEKISPEEILQFTNKINTKKKQGKPKKLKKITTAKNLGNDLSVTKVAMKDESPAEEKIITATENLKTRRKKVTTQNRTSINLGLTFEEKVKLVMEKYKDNTKCCRISLKGRFICTVCGKCFKDFSHLKRRHWPTHQENSNIVCVCDICGKSVVRRYMKQHKLRAHTTEEEKIKYQSKCNLCDEIVLSYDMASHLSKKHSKLPEVKCNECGKVCINNVRLKTHLIQVHSNAPEKCDLCGKVFKSTINLKNHKTKVHGNRDRKYCCEICPHKVCTKAELENHKKMHTDVREYICDECGKTFKYNAHFITHMKCHKEIAEKGEGSFTCALCEGKTFKHSLSLRKHMLRIHGMGKTKRFECSVCSKQLSSATILRTHENMHKEKPGFVPRVRTKLPEYIAKGQNSSDKLTSSSHSQRISVTESADNISQ